MVHIVDPGSMTTHVNLGPVLDDGIELREFIEFWRSVDPEVEKLWVAFKAKQRVTGNE